MITRLLRKIGVGIAICVMLCIFALAAETATVTANGGLNLRAAAYSTAQVYCTIPTGASVTVVEKDAEWSKVTYSGATGFVMTKYLKFPVYTNTGTVAVSAANIRSAPSETASCVTTINRGAQVTFTSFYDGWYTVKYGNVSGYIRGDLITVNTVGSTPSASTGSQKRTELVNFAATLLGTPYRSGGESPSAGFDCSGYTYYVFSKFGYSLPRGPAAQYNALGTSIKKSDLKPGDLVFFKNPYSGKTIGHVGIYVGNGQMIHSNKPGGSVRYVTINSGYYLTNYVGARRVIFD